MIQYEKFKKMPFDEMLNELTESATECAYCGSGGLCGCGDEEGIKERCTECISGWLNEEVEDSEPQIQQCYKNEYRPCIVGDKKALFHMWENFSKPIAADLHIGGSPAGVLSYTLAIVEFEDGTVDRVLPQEVKFVDNKFKEYVFGGKE